MDVQAADRSLAQGAKRIALRDVALVIAAVVGLVCANVGVVRALDVALDAIHR